MDSTTPLKAWMEKNGYTNRTLAERLGMSYELIYKLANGQKPSSGFKWEFAQVFGYELASELFVQPETEPL